MAAALTKVVKNKIAINKTKKKLFTFILKKFEVWNVKKFYFDFLFFLGFVFIWSPDFEGKGISALFIFESPYISEQCLIIKLFVVTLTSWCITFVAAVERKKSCS